MRDIRISDHGNWRHLHWNAIESAYNHTPFFEYYKDDFRPFYEQKYEFLADFNEELCHLVCSLIDLQPDMTRTTGYRTEFAPHETDFRERIHPKKDFALEDTEFSPQTQPLQALKYKDITEESSEGIFSVLPQPEILVRKA